MTVEALKRLRGHTLNNPIRLGIMVFLLSRAKTSFKTLQELLELTPGNLDFHLKALEREGYVRLRKAIMDRPRTVVEITDRGVEETRRYLTELRRVLEDVEKIY